MVLYSCLSLVEYLQRTIVKSSDGISIAVHFRHGFLLNVYLFADCTEPLFQWVVFLVITPGSLLTFLSSLIPDSIRVINSLVLL